MSFSSAGGGVKSPGPPTRGAGGDGLDHSLSFRVMRLCRPSLNTDVPFRVVPSDLISAPGGEPGPAPEEPGISNKAGSEFLSRFELRAPLDASGLGGMMVLPQSVGTIYLGETFTSYISVLNHTDHPVTEVEVKAEVQSGRTRVTVFDNAAARGGRIPSLPAGGRHDFIVEHDLKEPGAHSLVCTTNYRDVDGERKLLTQFFKFAASNPLSVRTKVRTVGGGGEGGGAATLLEACVENCTKAPILLESVRFIPSPSVTSRCIEDGGGAEEGGPGGGEAAGDPDDAGPLAGLIANVHVVRPGAGLRHYLYQLTRTPGGGGGGGEGGAGGGAGVAAGGAAEGDGGGGNTLGRFEIRWRGAMGETGRLQTQAIKGAPTVRKDVELRLVHLPPRVVVERPFEVSVELENRTERRLGPLRLAFAQREGKGKTIVISGPWDTAVDDLPPGGTVRVSLRLLALATGVHRLSGLSVLDARDSQPYDTLPVTDVQIFAS